MLARNRPQFLGLSAHLKLSLTIGNSHRTNRPAITHCLRNEGDQHIIDWLAIDNQPSPDRHQIQF
jgi:hypothetical protein